MTTRTVALQADLAVIPGVIGTTARTVVALPPSSLDPGSIVGGTVYDATTEYDATTVYDAEYVYDLIRVYVDRVRILRSFDPEMEPA